MSARGVALAFGVGVLLLVPATAPHVAADPATDLQRWLGCADWLPEQVARTVDNYHRYTSDIVRQAKCKLKLMPTSVTFDGDTSFLVAPGVVNKAKGVTGGSGTAEDPYFISGHEWDGRVVACPPLKIRNTKVHVRVDSNWFHDLPDCDVGAVRVELAQNVVVQSNRFSAVHTGIHAIGSSTIVAAANAFESRYVLHGAGIEDTMLPSQTLTMRYAIRSDGAPLIAYWNAISPGPGGTGSAANVGISANRAALHADGNVITNAGVAVEAANVPSGVRATAILNTVTAGLLSFYSGPGEHGAILEAYNNAVTGGGISFAGGHHSVGWNTLDQGGISSSVGRDVFVAGNTVRGGMVSIWAPIIDQNNAVRVDSNTLQGQGITGPLLKITNCSYGCPEYRISSNDVSGWRGVGIYVDRGNPGVFCGNSIHHPSASGAIGVDIGPTADLPYSFTSGSFQSVGTEIRCSPGIRVYVSPNVQSNEPIDTPGCIRS